MFGFRNRKKYNATVDIKLNNEYQIQTTQKNPKFPGVLKYLELIDVSWNSQATEDECALQIATLYLCGLLKNALWDEARPLLVRLNRIGLFGVEHRLIRQEIWGRCAALVEKAQRDAADAATPEPEPAPQPSSATDRASAPQTSRYLLKSDQKRTLVDASLFNVFLGYLRDQGWHRADLLFDLPTNTRNSMNGTFPVPHTDALDLARLLRSAAPELEGDADATAAIYAAIAVAESGAFTLYGIDTESAPAPAQETESLENGLTPGHPIIISTKSSFEGIDAEYAYLETHFGKQDRDWTIESRMHGTQGDRTFETFSIKLSDGSTRHVTFDISAFFGRF